MVSSTTFRRARRPEQKQQRREAILAAARALGLRDGVRNVSLGDVAREVGLAKSNVLRYFETREEIYLHLTAEGWRDWAQAVHAGLDGAAAGPAQVADVLSRTLEERPLFCDLLAHVPANLEHNVSPDAVREFKLTALASLDELAARVTEAMPRLGERGGFDLIALTTLLAGSLWHTANPPPALAALYRQDPALANACVEFAPTLRRLIGSFLNGFPGDAR
jgi:AcrR family transcriptional regulator